MTRYDEFLYSLRQSTTAEGRQGYDTNPLSQALHGFTTDGRMDGRAFNDFIDGTAWGTGTKERLRRT